MNELLDIVLAFGNKLGYWGVFLLMAIESSFIPFPSEVVIPPVAYSASQGNFNLFLVILFGVAGSLIGATVNYFLARLAGRALAFRLIEHRYAKYLLLNREKLENAEKFFKQGANLATFFGRLVPAVRQLISLPAGFFRMPFRDFIWFTFLGSSIWVSFLAVIGYFFGANQDLFLYYLNEFKVAIIIIFLIFCFWLVKKIKK